MKLFGFGREKPIPFPQFRALVATTIRHSKPNARIENDENGFILTLEGMRVACNLRNLYDAYSKHPGDRDPLVHAWIDSLITEVPDHTWSQARPLLRPTLKNGDFLAMARAQMLKSRDPDSLPYAPFAGELYIIVVRDLPGTAAAVTQKQLEGWGVTFEQALHEAVNNLNILNFPPVVNSFQPGGAQAKKGGAAFDPVGLDFRGDHLTATWLVMERFRDHLSLKLQGDYIAFVPNRGQIIAVRASEPGLINSILASNRNFRAQAHALTTQGFYVNSTVTGGEVTVFQQKAQHPHDTLTPFATGRNAAPAPPSPAAAPVESATQPPARELANWWGLNEPTDTAADNAPPPPWARGR